MSLARPLLLLALAAPLAAQAPPGVARLAEDVVRLPLDLTRDHLEIEVMIDGHGPYDFIVDTYASYAACLDYRVARALGLRRAGRVRNSDGSGTSVVRDVVSIGVLELGDGAATFEELGAMVDDFSWIKATDGDGIDGLLGFPLFAELLLQIDYPGAAMTLSKGRLPRYGAGVRPFFGAGRTPDVALKLGSEELLVGVDTGYSGPISLPPIYRRLVPLEHAPTSSGRVRTMYNEAKVMATTIEGPACLSGAPLDTPRVEFSTVTDQPLVGHQVLRDFVVTFDQRSERARFVRLNGAGLPLGVAHATEFVGRYQLDAGVRFHVRRTGELLELLDTESKTHVLRRCADDEFWIDEHPSVRLQFVRGRFGLIEELVIRRPDEAPLVAHALR